MASCSSYLCEGDMLHVLEIAFMEGAVVLLPKKPPFSQAKMGTSSDNRLQLLYTITTATAVLAFSL